MVGNKKIIPKNVSNTLLCRNAKKHPKQTRHKNTYKTNYKTTGSRIRSKEKLITEQEKPNNFFFDQEKPKT